MITLITGAPGAGKSAAVVELLAELSKTRTVYANGIPDLKIEYTELVDPTKWPEVVPDGSLIVIDEVQRIWRPRGPGVKVPPEIAALETHRHRGIDFYVLTQSPRLVDSNIRGLVGRHVHLRDLGILGRWWYEWPETADSCNTSWRQAPFKKKFRLSKAALALYTSASIHIKPIRSFPRTLILLAVALLVGAFLVYRSWNIIDARMHPKPAGAVASGVVGGGVVAGAVAAVAGAVSAGYDTLQFIPRLSTNPESAPAYDSLRAVVAVPLVIGGICVGETCRCFTQQNTLVSMSDNDCRKLVALPRFNPYLLADSRGADRAQARPGSHQAAAVPAQPPTIGITGKPLNF